MEDNEDLFTMIDVRTGEPFVEYSNDFLDDVQHGNWICDETVLQKILERDHTSPQFYCGTASNLRKIFPFFDKVFLLRASEHITRQRLSLRGTKEFANTKDVQDWVLDKKSAYEDGLIALGAIVIDAEGSVGDVADAILHTVDSDN